MSPSTFVGVDPASGDFECAFIPNGKREATHRTFTIKVTELDRMIEWIQEEKIDVVATEGAGGYTRPLERALREFFDFAQPFDEEVVRRVNAAYLGACTHMDRQIGKILDTLEELDSLNYTRVIYTSDHGEDRRARGLYGKFTMYEESVGVPLVMAGPDVPVGKVVNTPVSLVDCYPTAIEAVGAKDPENGSLPGQSLFELATKKDHDRVIFSEYHAVGSRRGYYMLLSGRYKLVYYVDAPNQLFDIEADPREEHDLAGAPERSDTLARLEAELKAIVVPEDADRKAREDQAAVIAREGGREEVIAGGSFDNSPVPGEEPKFH